MKTLLYTLFSVVGVFIAGLMAFIAYAHYLGLDVQRWDKKIEALCAVNGGADVATRVYETAVAPETKEYFVDLKPIAVFRIPERSKGVALGPQYPYVIETRVIEVLHDKDPSVVKYTERIVRVSDNKTLAERFGYQRSGGGIPLWDPSEIRNCPKRTAANSLDIGVFVNHPRRNEMAKK